MSLTLVVNYYVLAFFSFSDVSVCKDVSKICSNQYYTGFVTRVRRRVPSVEKELLTLPEHVS